jgi:hypothetical protein
MSKNERQQEDKLPSHKISTGFVTQEKCEMYLIAYFQRHDILIVVSIFAFW